MEGKKRFAGFLHPQAKQIVLKLIYYFNQDDGITRNVEQRVSEALGVSLSSVQKIIREKKARQRQKPRKMDRRKRKKPKTNGLRESKGGYTRCYFP